MAQLYAHEDVQIRIAILFIWAHFSELTPFYYDAIIIIIQHFAIEISCSTIKTVSTISCKIKSGIGHWGTTAEFICCLNCEIE